MAKGSTEYCGAVRGETVIDFKDTLCERCIVSALSLSRQFVFHNNVQMLLPVTEIPPIQCNVFCRQKGAVSIQRATSNVNMIFSLL